MTYEEMIKDVEELLKEKEAFLRGEIKDEMSPECRKNWIEKCNWEACLKDSPNNSE